MSTTAQNRPVTDAIGSNQKDPTSLGGNCPPHTITVVQHESLEERAQAHRVWSELDSGTAVY
jgi:hypothetical protein